MGFLIKILKIIKSLGKLWTSYSVNGMSTIINNSYNGYVLYNISYNINNDYNSADILGCRDQSLVGGRVHIT